MVPSSPLGKNSQQSSKILCCIFYDYCKFLPNGKEGTIEVFKYAACNCHRYFRHKEVVVNATQISFPLLSINISFSFSLIR
jgi:hypothetical protein